MKKTNEVPALQALMSLRLAADLVHQRTTGVKTASDSVLSEMAKIIAARTRVFMRDKYGAVAMLMPDEVLEGEFHAYGSAVRFDDGRPTLTELLIMHDQLERLIDEIGRFYRKSKQSV